MPEQERSSSSSTYTRMSKQMQYATLQSQLTKLDKNINTLKSNVNTAANYAPAFHKLQIIHASEFMAASKVLNEEEES
ncbi:hypothetical protein BCR43DRAFT_481097 [Syncephalastrum racemosum]|uniref:Uncharacterized protein n=1 Tax=Syncephalastrum racemosum TaxID=13706 RepID=A0A1X2HRI7_SYNRA|nr:hypothetical protein BCR43DRAFT_481097 [Syncephalastrum racemosum]